MTAATGINALAHCIEAVYSKTRNPLSTSAALRGIYHIKRSLVSCYRNGEDLGARKEMQLGAHLAGASLATVSMGIHHGTGHVLGGTAGVPHGIANCIVLPHAIRFNADTVPSQLALSAEAMGISREGRNEVEMAIELADHVFALISQLGMPQRLRDAGVDKSILPKLAENMLKSEAVRSNPKSVTSVTQTLPYLEAMW
jgi:alcohol dehydrogenase class IV